MAADADRVFDSHVHLDDADIADVATTWTAAAAAGVVGAVSAGYGPEREARAAALLTPGRPLWRAVGLHPWWLAAAPDDAARDAGLHWLDVAAAQPSVVAVGEIGLCATRRPQMAIEAQRRYFAAGLAIAIRHHRPVILHVVRWHGHALDVLARHPPPGGVVHRYGGPAELVAGYVGLGLSLSICTDALRRPERFAAVVRAIPADRLLVETDWPLDDRPWVDAIADLQRLIALIATWRGEAEALLRPRLVANAHRALRLTATPAP